MDARTEWPKRQKKSPVVTSGGVLGVGVSGHDLSCSFLAVFVLLLTPIIGATDIAPTWGVTLIFRRSIRRDHPITVVAEEPGSSKTIAVWGH